MKVCVFSSHEESVNKNKERKKGKADQQQQTNTRRGETGCSNNSGRWRRRRGSCVVLQEAVENASPPTSLDPSPAQITPHAPHPRHDNRNRPFYHDLALPPPPVQPPKWGRKKGADGHSP